jgi:hypothetical protein
MILFLNRNDENWPHTRQIKIAGRNHILPPLGIENTLIMQSSSIQKQRESAQASYLFRKTFDYIRMFSVRWLIEQCLMDVLSVSQRRRLTS